MLYDYEVYSAKAKRFDRHAQGNSTMSSTQSASAVKSAESHPSGSYFGYSEVVDYILGITYEIWEQGQIDKVLDYYGHDIDVFTMEGMIFGAEAMVTGTRSMLESFPDRLLLGDAVLWSGNLSRGFSSHRIISPMTNSGNSAFGPATGRSIVAMNIADCEITEGKITREWLFRDNVSVLTQLGFDPMKAARLMSSKLSTNFRSRLAQEYQRVREQKTRPQTIGMQATDSFASFAVDTLQANWTGNGSDHYAPYAVLQRAPVRIYSGREAISAHYESWRGAFPDARLTVDHVCSQPFDHNGNHVAVRWSVAGRQEGPMGELEASGNPAYLVGATHWRILDGRIINEWTVFDEVALMAQLMDGTD